MVRFNLWPWQNALRVWKSAITKKGLSFSNKAIEKGVEYLEIDARDSLSEACEKKNIQPHKGLNFREMDHRINGIIFQHLRELYDGGVADFQTYLVDVFFYYYGESENDLMQDEFTYFKKLFDDMPNGFKKGVQLAKNSKNRKKVLLKEFLNSDYLN